MWRALGLLSAWSLGSTVLGHASESTSIEPESRTRADYDRAVALLEPNLAAHIFNNRIRFRWLEGGKALEYVTNDFLGPRRVHIEVASGARTTLAETQLTPSGPSPISELPSPDGRLVIFRRADNLWLRDQATKSENRLTQDGEPFFSYGKLFDDSTRTIERIRDDAPMPLFNVFWSPDSRLIVGQRNDERQLLPYPYVESVPLNGSFRPILHEVRMTLLGEPGRIIPELFIADVVSGRKIEVAIPGGWQADPVPIGWSPDSRKMYLLATAVDKRGSALLEVDALSGRVRQVIVEKSATSSAYFFNVFEYSYPNVRVLNGASEVVWFSQRDGWAHLYLYDLASGKLKRSLTPGDGLVLDIIACDEAGRRLFVTMAGRDKERDPYQRDLYSIPLDQGSPQKLTPGESDHEIAAPTAPFWAGIMTARADTSVVSPDGRSFIDVASTLESEPVTTLRSTHDGRAIAELERADASQALAMGWRPPIRFHAKAADGITDLWGAIYLPGNYDPSKRYPVINALYGGPQLIVAPRSFNEGGPYPGLIARASLASLGFVVVTVDGRGTPGRARKFWEAGYGNFADPGIDDHVAVIKQLSQTYSGMDLNRVGVYGHSFGGYVSARSILRYPEFYKVAVSSAAVHNWQGFREAYEQYQGVIDYGGAARVMPNPTAIPEHYRMLDNAALADRLKGKLLIAYADLDENALPSSTLQFLDSLTKANKDYDLVYMANGNHGFGVNPYFLRRSIDYFVIHLLGAAPPPDFKIDMAPWLR